MSIITSWPALPNRMTIVWSYLKRSGADGIDAEELKHLFSPKSLQKPRDEVEVEVEDKGSGTAIVDQVVDEMRKLGLLERGTGVSLALAPGGPEGDEGAFLAYLEPRLLDPVKAEAHGQGAFPLALSWFLVQDPATPLLWGENHVKKVHDECGEESASFELTNSARFQQFVYWARYLGFAWRLETKGANVVFPDPTLAVARHLPGVIGNRGQRPIQKVMPALALQLPVLEWGTARNEVESRLPSGKRRSDGQLSRSTSLALERLELQGRLVLERVADAPAVNLDVASGLRAVSHVTWRDGG